MTSEESAPQPGYYGKVPTNGDFISRRLAESLVAPWDGWLRAGLAASRHRPAAVAAASRLRSSLTGDLSPAATFEARLPAASSAQAPVPVPG